MGGKTAQKTGDDYPSFPETLKTVFALLIFNRFALYRLIADKLHLFNLITITLIAFLMPFKSPFTGEIEYFNFEKMIESVLVTVFFLVFLFLLCRDKTNIFMPLLRIMLAMEATAVVVPLSLLLSGTVLKVFMGLYVAWYLSLAVFAFSHLNSVNYPRAVLAVFTSFFLAQLLPAVLS